MTATALERLLDDLVAPVAGHGDWDDVLRRAGIAPQPAAAVSATPRPAAPHRRRTAIALALAVLGLGVALFATPAFGLRDRVLALLGRTDVPFERGEPAAPVVRYRFEDLGLGAPPGMAPQAIARETRRVGTIRINGKERKLWVAPTRRGGFCYEIEGAYGGCLHPRDQEHPLPPVTLTYASRADTSGVAKILHVGGTVHSKTVARITVEFRDGATRDVPFLFVSEPIGAGFFSLDIPSDRQERPRGPRAVVARDEHGNVVWRDRRIHYLSGSVRGLPGPRGPVVRRRLPARLALPPSAPLRRGTGGGVRVVAGANGIVLFDGTAADPSTRRFLRGSVTYGCFRLVRRQGVLQARGVGIMARFTDKAAARFFGLGPLDACEIQGSYGHRWPDRLGSHSPVEVPFTDAARAYFTDRAAARNLALFVRTRRVQRIRRSSGEALAAELRREFGGTILRLGPGAAPPLGRIAYRPTPRGGVFLTTSETGRRFQVVVVDGRIGRENVEPFALVF